MSNFYSTINPYKRWIDVYDILIKYKFKSPFPKAADIGCSSGYITDKICSLFFNCIGFDSDPEEIQRAKKTYPNHSFYNFTVDEFISSDKYDKYDLMLFLGVYQHLGDIRYANKILDKMIQATSDLLIMRIPKRRLKHVSKFVMNYLKQFNITFHSNNNPKLGHLITMERIYE